MIHRVRHRFCTRLRRWNLAEGDGRRAIHYRGGFAGAARAPRYQISVPVRTFSPAVATGRVRRFNLSAVMETASTSRSPGIGDMPPAFIPAFGYREWNDGAEERATSDHHSGCPMARNPLVSHGRHLADAQRRLGRSGVRARVVLCDRCGEVADRRPFRVYGERRR